MSCPRCRHGKNGGHNGRACIAIVYVGPDREPDYCGCKYTEGKKDTEEPQ